MLKRFNLHSPNRHFQPKNPKRDLRSLYFPKEDIRALTEALKGKAITSVGNVRLLISCDDGVFCGTKDVDEISITAPVQTYLDLQSFRVRGQVAAQRVQ